MIRLVRGAASSTPVAPTSANVHLPALDVGLVFDANLKSLTQ